LQNIFKEFETFAQSTPLFTTSEIEEEIFMADKKIFDMLEFFFISKLNFLKIDDVQDIYNLKTIKKFDQIWNLLYEDNTSKARRIYEEVKDDLDYFHQLILQDIILTSEYNFKESIKITAEIIEKFPENFIGYLFQSITYFLMDNYENSIKVIENGLKKAPHYLLWCQKAQILIKNLRGLEILDKIDKEISKHPQKITLLRIKFMIHITHWDRLVINREYTAIVLDSAIKLDPNNTELLLLKSIYFILINKNKEAKRLLVDNIELSIFKRNPQIDIATFFIIIFSYVARGKFQKALKVVNQLNQFYPNHPISFLSKAFVLGYNIIYKFTSEELNLDPFLQLVNQAISYEKLKYNKIKFLTLQAAVLYGINQFERVIKTINTGIELAPDLYYIHYIKVYYLIIANRSNEVLNLIEDLVKKFPDFKYLLYDRKVLSLFKAKRYKEALKVADILIDFDPKNIEYLNNKVFILGYLGRKKEAIATAEKLIELNPKIGNSYDTFGEIYLIFGEYENAIKKFEESVKIEPSSDCLFITIIRLAYCYMKINNYEKANEYFEKGKNLAERMIPSKRKFFLQEAKCILEELKSMTENK
jgi:tetratricopeptide (TPR) repeat protein